MADTPVNITAKKAQPSRKGKKAWRKNVDVGELETGLEALRSEERVRGTTDELPEEEHFTVDISGDAEVKKQMKKDRPLRVDQIIAERSAVPPLQGRYVNKLSKPTFGEASKHQQQKINQMAKRKLKATPKPKAKKAKKSFDMWNDDQETTADDNDYLASTVPHKVKAPSTMARIPKVILHKAAVEVPHAGASYNPTQEEHQALLQKAADVEIAKYNEEKKLDHQLSYRKELDSLPHELQHLEKQADETSTAADADDADEDDDSSDETNDVKKTKAERKTKAQRRKEQRIKEEHTVWERKQLERKIRNEIDNANLTKKELEEREKLLERLAKERVIAKDRKEKEGMKRVGHFFVQDMSMEVQLEDELSESLRQLKPEGSIFKDRFVSIQRRNIIEPRSPLKAPKRKYARKVYEKRSYKTFDITEKKKEQYKQILQRKN
ncbi:ribosome biogenesis protein Nop53/GLTSCR2 [Absidia repens]|uniref:Ribosome biogenesis protein NOP53 n=1 Tax=Absidia repens TaxID=90262 RepID=A0A1X2I7B8_9FUNG|nr:ribosome biogenesis protein Nop53/GLTSCR2 [Absidia repens]